MTYIIAEAGVNHNGQINLAHKLVEEASKAGVEGFSRSLAREVSDFNIKVNCIAPGPIKTNLLKRISDNQINKIVSSQLIKKKFTTNDVCDVVEMLLDKKSESLTGQVFHIGGV